MHIKRRACVSLSFSGHFLAVLPRGVAGAVAVAATVRRVHVPDAERAEGRQGRVAHVVRPAHREAGAQAG